MGLLDFIRREKVILLSEEQILDLRDWVDFKVGETSIVKGKVIPSTPIPSADGYAVISFQDQNTIVKFSSFYPVERIQERRERGWTPYGREDFALRQLPSGVYTLHPKGIRSLWFYHTGDVDFGQYAERLRQGEFNFSSPA